jgi:hypothetical protein
VIFGMTTLTFAHVVISLIGIVSGLVVLAGMFASRLYAGWTATFLATTIATSVTGFLFFPFDHLLPSHMVGILSLVILAIALYALYARGLAGAFRSIYVITATLALYLNVFVLVAQLFAKVPALKALAPTQAEPPFAIAQGIVLVLFLLLGWKALRKFHPANATRI